MYKVPVTILCIILILYLFWVDRKNKEGVSNAIWIPFISLLFAQSREFSFWLYYWFHIGFYSESLVEGNLIDRIFSSILLIAGISVLINRRLNWAAIFKNNSIIWVYFIYGFVSIIWSDYPFVSLKRFIKTSGTIVMALIILTEARPFIALGAIMRRLAFILLPLSVLFIWYYPDLGKGYHSYSGTQWFTGVTSTKNGLGALCLAYGIYFSWNLLFGRSSDGKLGQRLHLSIYIIILPMIVWLLHKANSATSLSCIIIAVSILIVARQRFIAQAPLRIMIICLGCIIIYGMLELLFDLKNTVITMLGRRPDLTTRIPMWDDLLSMVKHPLIGCGYESFWLGERLTFVQERWGKLVQAHNGYLETYLNLGGIGLSLLILWILSGFKKIANYLPVDYLPAVIRFCLLVVVCFYNYTEATFYGTGMTWLLFLLATLDISGQNREMNLPAATARYLDGPATLSSSSQATGNLTQRD